MDQDNSSFINQKPAESSIKSLSERVDKLEDTKVMPLHHEVDFLKELIEMQGMKLEKLQSLVTELLKADSTNSLLALSSIQDNDVSEEVRNQVQDQVEQQVRQHVGNHDDLQIEGNIHPELQVTQVAQTAVNNQGGDQEEMLAEYEKEKKRKNAQQRDLAASPNGSNKRPKIAIDFIHNPMTVREIYEEFTKGFKGQPPLCELDERFGKAQWRGDSRSKESKRYQRRKRLCDAIKKGMNKYGKTADEIISYIEEYRGDKSLTWVMNGNLPEDLMMGAQQ